MITLTTIETPILRRRLGPTTILVPTTIIITKTCTIIPTITTLLAAPVVLISLPMAGKDHISRPVRENNCSALSVLVSIVIYVYMMFVMLMNFILYFKGCVDGGSVAKLYVGGIPRNVTEHDVN